MAFEYTPEITADYLTQLKRPIEERGVQQVGQARGEALRRGLTGDPFESLRVGSAQASTNRDLTGTEANLAYNTAGLRREERMVGEKNIYESAEAEKQRVFQEKMSATMFNYQNALQASQNLYNKQQNQRSFWPNLLSSAVGYGTGAAVGNWTK